METKKKQYFEPSRLHLIIKFPSHISSIYFEAVLKECYLKSHFKKYKKIEFDFSNVLWCDVFELSLSSLWLLELKSQGKEIIFRFPQNKGVCKFLKEYKFNHFLDSNNIISEGTETIKAAERPNELLYAPYYPLTFFNEDGFRKALHDLHYGNRLELLLNDIKNAEIVKSGVIKDVVLKELGDNIFLHGEGQFANIIMTKFGSDSPEKAKLWAEATLKQVSDLEKPFFNKLYGRPFLAIVISDKGEGIYSSLRKAYEKDIVINNKKENPTEHNILEYAFLYHSSRRPIDERIGAIKKVISGEIKEFQPPTGLYHLKEVTREFQGFLYLRSGSSIICYDFYNNPMNDNPVTNENIKGLKKIASFGGTQYKLYFPVNIPKRLSDTRYFIFDSSKQLSASLHYNYLPMKSYFTSETLNNLDEEASQLHKVFGEIERIKYKNKDKQKGLILDFDNAPISQKALHYLLLEALQRETQFHINIGINLDSGIIRQQNELSVYKDVLFTKPLALFDKNFIPYLFGVTSNEATIFNDLLKKLGTQTEEMKLFAIKNAHLFSENKENNRYEFLHSGFKIMEQVRTVLKNKMQNVILGPSLKIFDKDIKVLIPSGSYCKGYFETYKLFADGDGENTIQTWFKYWMMELAPDFIISISSQCGTIVNKIIGEIKTQSNSSVKHINLRTPIRDIDYIKLVLELEKNKKIIVFTDVIGTAETVKLILEKAQHTNILKVFSLVNAKSDEQSLIELKGKTFEIESIVKQKLIYYDDLPQGWIYNDIHLVDPDTHVLVKNTEKPEGPLWKKIEYYTNEENGETFKIRANKFFDDVVIHGIVKSFL